MQKTLVRYRTNDVPCVRHAVVPTLWLSDLLEWLQLSEEAVVIGITHDENHGLIIPMDWPGYRTCLQYSNNVSLVESR